MKTILLSVIFLISTSCINSQSFRLGMVGNFLTGNKYYSYQFGPALLAEYSFDRIPISVRGSTGYIFPN